MSNRVGIEFYAAGAAQVARETNKIAGSLGGFAKFGAAFLGGAYTLRFAGRALREFFSDSISYSKEATTQIQKLNSTWEETKRLIGTSLGAAGAPLYQGANAVLEAINMTIKDATELKGLFDKLTASEQAAVSAAYQLKTGGRFGYYNVPQVESPQYLRAAGPMGALAASAGSLTPGTGQMTNITEFAKPDDQIVAFNLMKEYLTGDEVSGVSKAQEAARAKVVQLNEALVNQIRVQRLLNEGNREGAQVLAFQMAAEEGYAANLELGAQKLKYYLSDLEKLKRLRSEFAVDKYAEKMQDEQEYLRLIIAGRREEVAQLKAVNEMKRQGIDLTRDEEERIRALVAENEQLSRAAEKKTHTERFYLDTLDKGVEGFGDAAARALIYGERFSDLLRQLALDIGYDITREMITSPIKDFLGLTPRASGGRVYPGQGYMVGERGPEPFFPDRPGTIVPAGGGAPSVSVQVVNNGTPKSARATEPRWDASLRAFVTQVILDDATYGGPISQSARR